MKCNVNHIKIRGRGRDRTHIGRVKLLVDATNHDATVAVSLGEGSGGGGEHRQEGGEGSEEREGAHSGGDSVACFGADMEECMLKPKEGLKLLS